MNHTERPLSDIGLDRDRRAKVAGTSGDYSKLENVLHLIVYILYITIDIPQYINIYFVILLNEEKKTNYFKS